VKSKISFFGKRYYLLTIVVCFVFIYLLFTEVYDRYSNTWTLYQALREKEASVLDPVHLEQKKSVLTEERDSLSSRILKERSSYQQNEIGVIQSISDNARKDQVTIESVDPGKLRQTGEFQELDFGVSVSAKFSQLGLFINGLENATIPFDLTKVQIISNPIGEGNLQVNIQAKAFLYHGVH
jgi:Tfp pilus assembly protein PilO